MTIRFIPNWTISAGQILAATEGTNYDIQLTVEESYVLPATAGTFQAIVGPNNAVLVTTVSVNGQPIGFQPDDSGQEVVFADLPYDCTLSIIRQTQATFSLLNGALPNGMILNQNGAISGTPENIFPDHQTFTFTVRATNEYAVRDRQFSIVMAGAATPALFNPATLPALVSIPIASHAIGSYELGQSLWFSLDVIQKDFDIPSLSMVSTPNLIETSAVIAGLPAGIAFTSDNQIKGRVDLAATPGTYVFSIQVNDPIAPFLTVFSLIVQSSHTTTVDIPLTMSWATTAGPIGSIQSLLPSCLGVAATNNLGTPVYSLSPFSAPLPSGLTLNPATGGLDGIPDFLLGAQETDFVARCTIGTAFIERPFSVIVSSTFSTSDVAKVFAIVDASQSATEIANLSTVIPTSAIFHPGDPHFGLQTRPIINIVEGLRSTMSIASIMTKDTTAIGRQSFYYPVRLFTGSLKIVSVSDSFGNPLYDVLLRALFDPNAGAGGFVLDENSNVTVQQVLDRDGPVLHPVYVNSIDNIRYDLITKLGFQASSALITRIGATGPELVQPWMGSTFQLALPLAYLQPGSGASVLKIINKASGIAAMGNPIDIGMLFVARPTGTQIIPLL